MLFNSYNFLFIYFPLVTVAYFLLPHRFRWILLLLASCYFYMSFIPVYILILAFTILVDYIAGLMIESSSGTRRRAFLIMSIIANVGVLAVFKYCDFVTHNLVMLAGFLGLGWSIPHLSIILPIGLSFHTFQSLSYTIEVYRGNQKAERKLGMLALYVMYYPQLVAGPIERPQNLLHQLNAEHSFDCGRVVNGLKIMVWGLFMKVVVADRLAVVVDQVFAQPAGYTGMHYAIALIFFSYQIYCDFAGYSYIAIGAAKVMGVDLMTNFDRPYAAQSIAEFWRRWHISLSTWFKDYVYIPLGGNRSSVLWWVVSIMIVFMISGLWHGAKWTFVIWGALHGMYMLGGRLLAYIGSARIVERPMAGLAAYMKWPNRVFVFVLVGVAWMFFRAESLNDALMIFTGLHKGWAGLIDDGVAGACRSLSQIGLTFGQFGFAIILIMFVELISRMECGRQMKDMFSGRPAPVRWGLYTVLVLLIINCGTAKAMPFIYFQF